MVNSRFYINSGPYKLSEIICVLGDKVEPIDSKYQNILVHDIKSLERAKDGDITFLSNEKYVPQFYNTESTVCIVHRDFVEVHDNKVILLRTEDVYFVYTKIIDLFYNRAKVYLKNKIMDSATIAKSATIGHNCYIGHNVVIEDNVVIGDNSIIESGTFIDYGVVIGNRATIYSGVSISYSIIGDDVVILAGAKIGQDGFGFVTNQELHHKIFHTGIVKIGNNVEIGANSTIDRGSVSDTIIEDYCKIDNLVQIGHNVIIGKGTIIVAQVGIAGSSKVGKYCVFGGQVGIAGHICIGDQVQIASKSGVMKNIEKGTIVGGIPAVPIKDWHRQTVMIKKLIRRKNNES